MKTSQATQISVVNGAVQVKTKRKTPVSYGYKRYGNIKPTKIKVNATARFKKVFAIKQFQNSLDAQVKLGKMAVMQSVYVTRKQLELFRSAAKIGGFKITYRQGRTNQDKVRIWKLA